MNQNTNQNPSQQQKMPDKRNLIISGAVIVAVLVALILAPHISNKSDKKGAEEEQTTEEAVTSQTPKALSRADATAKYAGNILSFETTEAKACAANTDTFTVAAGTTIMLDNKTTVRRTIMVAGKSYSVGSERYTLSSMNMGLGEHIVSCDGSIVAKIIIK